MLRSKTLAILHMNNNAKHMKKNFSGSAVIMEAEVVKAIFERSLTKHNLLYQTCLCDGDAKTMATLKKMDIYTDSIQKEDCINHIKEDAIRNNDTQKVTHGEVGQHQLKEKVKDKVGQKIANYYADATKRNIPDIKAMKNTGFAYLHLMAWTGKKQILDFVQMGNIMVCLPALDLSNGETCRTH